MSKKISFGIIITIFGLLAGFFCFLFFNCINVYNSFNIQYEDLIYEELTFEKYEKIHKGKNGSLYEIYFEEFNKPFEVSVITQKMLDKEALNELESNTIVEVYYHESTSKSYIYEICEMKRNSVEFLSLENYKKVNQNNQIVGMILCPLLIIGSAFLIWMYVYLLKRDVKLEKAIKNGDVISLGKIKIEYISDGNVIRLYNSFDVCSLVINNQVVDQYFGAVATRFCLQGEVEKDGKKILVEAKMGFVNMRLYYDGKLVKKIFMGLG